MAWLILLSAWLLASILFFACLLVCLLALRLILALFGFCLSWLGLFWLGFCVGFLWLGVAFGFACLMAFGKDWFLTWHGFRPSLACRLSSLGFWLGLTCGSSCLGLWLGF